jgi:uncharacterized protein YgiM (DUF1202 family)
MRILVTGSMALLLFSTPLLAETVYIKQRQVASVRSAPTADGQIVGRAATGTGLELLEQNDTHSRVRIADGTEGWVANSFIEREKPASMKILAAETKLKLAQADAAKLSQKVKELEYKLKTQQASLAKAANAAEAQAKQEPEPGPVPVATKFSLDPLWLAISFAMLIAGFAAGALWLRERTRRKLGGMHIRVS